MPNTIIAATSGGLYAVAAGPGPDDRTFRPAAYGGRHVRGMASSNGVCYAIVNRHEIWKVDEEALRSAGGRRDSDGGLQADATKIAELDEQLWCLFVYGQELIIGTEGAHLYRMPLDGGTPVHDKSFADNPDRDSWFTPWGGPPAVRSITSDAAGALYVNVHVGGIHKQAPGSAAWEQLIEIDFDVHQVLATTDPPLLLAPGGKGFAQAPLHGSVAAALDQAPGKRPRPVIAQGETEGGGAGVEVSHGGERARWDKTRAGLDFSYMRAVAVSEATLLVSAATGPHGDRGAVYSRPLGSTEPFQKLCEGLPQWFGGNVDTFCLQGRGNNVALGAPGGSLYFSPNNGQIWGEVAAGLPEINGVWIM